MAKFIGEAALSALINKIISQPVASGNISLVSGVTGTSTLRKASEKIIVLSMDLQSSINLPEDTQVGTLPSGFRPTTEQTFSCTAIWSDNTAGAAKLRIATDGKMYATGFTSWASTTTSKAVHFYANCAFCV
jgi:hypothetical protein